MEELARIYPAPNHDTSAVSISRSKWMFPPENDFKLNVEAAIFKETNQAGMGAVLRTHRGHAVGVVTQKLPFNGDPLQSETLSLREAL